MKPCPWCGEPLTVVTVSEGSTFRWRKVNGCCADGPEVRHDTMASDQPAAEADSRARAIAAWNTRAAPAKCPDACQHDWQPHKVFSTTYQYIDRCTRCGALRDRA